MIVFARVCLGDEAVSDRVPVRSTQQHRAVWRQYYPAVYAVLFYVDSGNRELLAEGACACSTRTLRSRHVAPPMPPPPRRCCCAARDVLHEVVAAPELAGAALLVVANKQDVPGAAPVIELIRELRLDTLPLERRWHIQGACARTGDGLFDGLDWVASLWTASS